MTLNPVLLELINIQVLTNPVGLLSLADGLDPSAIKGPTIGRQVALCTQAKVLRACRGWGWGCLVRWRLALPGLLAKAQK